VERMGKVDLCRLATVRFSSALLATHYPLLTTFAAASRFN
jgi:hypothetical protein